MALRGLLRSTQKKVNLEIQVKIVKIICKHIQEDESYLIDWKRGPETQTTKQIDLNEYQPDDFVDETFAKVSSFYSKDNGTTWE